MRPALVALFAGGCGGPSDDDGELEPFEPACTTFDVLATVYDPMGGIVDDAEVEFTVVLHGEITDTPCDSNGDGTYLCVGDFASTNQQVSAFPSQEDTQELQGVAVKVQAPKSCDETVEVDLYLMPDGMA